MGASSPRRKHHQKSDFPFLPEDIFFHILIWLPADFLHNYARFVCKSWSMIISDPVFIGEQFKRSKDGLFFQISDMPWHGNHLHLREGVFEVEVTNRLFPARLVSISRGLSLFYQVHPKNVLYVANLTTRKSETLPSPLSRKERFLGCYIIFVPQSSQYKVLYCVRFCKACKWRVWTQGNDKTWRNLEISSMSNFESRAEKISVSAGGVLYLSKGRGAISAVDLNLETGYSVQIPDEFANKLYWLREMENNLSCGVNQKGNIHVYILNDSITSEWVKVYKLEQVVDKKRFLHRTLVPVGWLQNGRKFIFIILEPSYWKNRYIVAYDVKTKKSVMHLDNNFGVIHAHTNSLISW